MKKSDEIENNQSSSPVWEPLKNQIRSMEVTDMLERPPSWLMKWGMYAILFTIGVFLLSASVIQYPEAVEVKLHISTYPESSTIGAGSDGIIKNIFTNDRDIVGKDQLIAELNSRSDWQTVQNAEKFAKNVFDSLELEDSGNLKYLLEKSRIETLGECQELYDDLLHTISIYLVNRVQSSHKTKTEISLMRLEIINQTRKLIRGLESWKANYLIMSPHSGRFYFSKPCRPGDVIKNNEKIGFVVPSKFVYQLQLLLSPIEAKKMSVGQNLKLELNVYPSVDYGALEVAVDSVSKIIENTEFSSQSKYRIYFKPLTNFVTDKNIMISIRPNISYRARLITGEKSLLTRFIETSTSDSK